METLGDRTPVYDNTGIRSSGIAVTTSAVSWGAILAGAVVAVAMSLILFILGIGLGLTSVSPWSQEGVSAATFGISTIGWITFTSLVASALGGYLTGRLRTRWAATQTDEVFFRDTAHGFLAWSVATLLTATLFTTVTASFVSGGVRAGAAVAGGVADAAMTTAGAATGAAGAALGSGMLDGQENGPMAYFLDSLFRRDPAAATAPQSQPAQQPDGQAQAGAADATTEEGLAGNAAIAQPAPGSANPSQAMQASQEPAIAEVARIFMRALQRDELAQNDLAYIGQLVAQYTGISAQEAETRVRETFDNVQAEMQEMETTARQVADEARATSAYVSLWFFVALLIGAFVASLAATCGGRQRDLD